MSLIKDPSGSFYLESDQFNVDYEENSIKFVGESGEGATYTAGEGYKCLLLNVVELN